MSETTRLPLPIARLYRRARNAKSPVERHDAAFWAWEASVRLAVAARPPADAAPLATGTFGHWVAAASDEGAVLDRPELARVHDLFRDSPTAGEHRVAPARLLADLAAYRNRVVGHGALQSPEFYERAGPTLLDGLAAAWDAGLFWPRAAHLMFVESIAIDEHGAPVPRLLELSGEVGVLLEQTAPEPGLLPHRLYCRAGAEWTCLHPWVAFRDADLREQVFFFNGWRRSARYLDFASGETVSGQAVGALHPDLLADLAACLGLTPANEAAAPVNAGALPTDLAEAAAVAPAAAAVQPRVRFGDFVLLEPIGSGAMGEIHLARQESLGRHVALKILARPLAAAPSAIARFRREITALARCEHRNVVKIFSCGEANGTFFYAMEYVPGSDLRRLSADLSSGSSVTAALRTSHELTDPAAVPAAAPVVLPGPSSDGVRELTAIFRDAAAGVAHLHQNGIIHRDIKPANLMVTPGDLRAVVMDLGLASFTDASHSVSQDQNRLLGTLRYMAPEQMQRSLLQVDQRADVYGLGATFYELLTGRPLFDGDTQARLVEQILHETPPRPRRVNPRIPRDLETILLTATEKDRRLRYASAEALRDDLDRFLDNRPIEARPPSAAYLLGLAIRRNRPLALTVALSLALLVAVTLGFILTLQNNLAETELSRDVAWAYRLVKSPDELFPAVPEIAPAMADWLASVDRLLAKEDAYRRRHTVAGPRDPARSLLDDLLPRIEVLKQTRPIIAARHADAASLAERSIGRYAREWAGACAEIRGLPAYGGLEIAPQVGLVPLRRSPQSGWWEFWHISSGARPVPAAGQQGNYEITPEIGIVLVLLPGGEYHVGAVADPFAEPNETLQPTTLDPFFIAKYEVTRAQYERAIGRDPSYCRNGIKEGLVFSAAHPVDTITWHDATEFCRRVGLDLPTEARWEYACRAGTSGPWWCGTQPQTLRDAENILDQSAQSFKDLSKLTPQPWDDGYPLTAPVGSFAPNPFGLYDMHGNVSEWCEDGHDSDAVGSRTYRAGDGLLSQTSPLRKIHRGGSCLVGPKYSRTSYRMNARADQPAFMVGLRAVRCVY